MRIIEMSANTGALVENVKLELLRVLESLPSPRQIELLDFARFLQQIALTEPVKASTPQEIELRVVPAASLLNLTGLVRLGGDAVADTEALYDDCSN